LAEGAPPTTRSSWPATVRALPIDLEELASVLEGDPLTAGGRIGIRMAGFTADRLVDR
jgi:hypothetical protein